MTAKNPLHVALTHAIMEETWRISPEMRVFLMKKLFSLLMAFSLVLVPMLSFADESSGATQNIYNMLLEELTAANLSMTPYDDINRIYLGYMLEKNALGNAVIIFDAYSDGFIIGVGYDKPIDEALVPQVISLFNDINCAVYVGKMVVSQSSDGWHPSYEIFVSANPDDISTWARENVLAYMYLALDTMEEMVDYITELANGETPENVFAMWYADSSAE